MLELHDMTRVLCMSLQPLTKMIETT